MEELMKRVQSFTREQKDLFWDTAWLLWRENARVRGVQRLSMLSIAVFTVVTVIVVPVHELFGELAESFVITMQVFAVLSLGMYWLLGRWQADEHEKFERLAEQCASFGVDRKLLEDAAGVLSRGTPWPMRLIYRKPSTAVAEG